MLCGLLTVQPVKSESSEVFACATQDKVFVYDLNVDKIGKLAESKPAKQPKLTNIAYNQRDPILLVGDTQGGITLLKLSPNLTKCKEFGKYYSGCGSCEFCGWKNTEGTGGHTPRGVREAEDGDAAAGSFEVGTRRSLRHFINIMNQYRDSRTQKLFYQIWNTGNRIFCSGKLLTGYA